MEPLINLNAEPKKPSGWIVQRYSGASVGKFGVKIAEDIVKFVFIGVVRSPVC